MFFKGICVQQMSEFADRFFFLTCFEILISFFYITNGLNALLLCLWFHLKCSSILALRTLENSKNDLITLFPYESI